jgi:hypothetical protein
MDAVGEVQGNGNEFQEIEPIENGRFSVGVQHIGGCVRADILGFCGRRANLRWTNPGERSFFR